MRNRQTVLFEIKKAVLEERKSQLKVLELLREFERDRHFLEMGYPTLFEFATRELGYSSGAAHRRIQSMRLLKIMPELEGKIEEGSLSLCVAAKTQSFFYQEERKRKAEKQSKLSLESKQEIVQSMLGLSTRECERKLVEISPESVGACHEKIRCLADGKTLIQFSADPALMEKLEKLKGLLAHRNFEGRYEVLFGILADLALKKFDPEAKACRLEIRVKDPVSSEDVTFPTMEKISVEVQTAETEEDFSGEKKDFGKSRKSPLSPSLAASLSPARSRFIPIGLKRAIWIRDGGRCTYTDPQNTRRCTSRHALQYDHAESFAWGGPTTLKNLRLRCSFHNAYTASELGLSHIN